MPDLYTHYIDGQWVESASGETFANYDPANGELVRECAKANTAEIGILSVNAGTIGAQIQLPFGGTKATGNEHRDGDTAAIDVFSEWQALYIDDSGNLQKAQRDAVGEEVSSMQRQFGGQA